MKIKTAPPRLLKYIGNKNELVYGKTYFVWSCSDTQYSVFNRCVENGIRIDLIIDAKENFIEPDKFRTHVNSLILAQTT